MGEGAKRVLAGVVGNLCDGRLSGASCFEAVDRVRHLRQTQTLLPAIALLFAIIPNQALCLRAAIYHCYGRIKKEGGW